MSLPQSCFTPHKMQIVPLIFPSWIAPFLFYPLHKFKFENIKYFKELSTGSWFFQGLRVTNPQSTTLFICYLSRSAASSRVTLHQYVKSPYRQLRPPPPLLYMYIALLLELHKTTSCLCLDLDTQTGHVD